MSNGNENGWNEWAKHVLTELDRLLDANEHLREGFEAFKLEIAKELVRKIELEAVQKSVNELNNRRFEDLATVRTETRIEVQKVQDDVSRIEKDHSRQLTELQLKAGVWGALAGAIPAVLALVIYLLTKG